MAVQDTHRNARALGKWKIKAGSICHVAMDDVVIVPLFAEKTAQHGNCAGVILAGKGGQDIDLVAVGLHFLAKGGVRAVMCDEVHLDGGTHVAVIVHAVRFNTAAEIESRSDT